MEFIQAILPNILTLKEFLDEYEKDNSVLKKWGNKLEQLLEKTENKECSQTTKQNQPTE